MRTGKFLGKAIDVVEVAVGLVLVLLVQLAIVESAIVELGVGILGLTSGSSRILLAVHRHRRRELNAIAVVEDWVLDRSGFLGGAGMNLGSGGLGLSRECTDSGDETGSAKTAAPNSGRLDSKSLTHDGTALAKQLQLGEGTATW